MTVYRCVQCVLEFASREEHQAHTRSDLHVHNLKRKVAGLEALSAAEFERRAQPPAPASRTRRAALPREQPPAQPTGGAHYEDGLCFFDRERCGDGLLAHLTQRHSFKIPDHEYCVDVPGLLRALGRQVWEQRECLWCLRTFRTPFDVQQHMHDAGHMRVGRLYEYQVETYAPFYDFSSSINEINLPAAAGWESVVTHSLEDEDEYLVVMCADDLVSTEKWRPQVLEDGSLYIPTSSKIVPHRFGRRDFGDDPTPPAPRQPNLPKLPWPKWNRAHFLA